MLTIRVKPLKMALTCRPQWQPLTSHLYRHINENVRTDYIATLSTMKKNDSIVNMNVHILLNDKYTATTYDQK